MFYLCKLVTVFGSVPAISHLFPMPFFMRGEELEPLIRVQASQKRMRHPVFTEVAAPGLFDERQRPLPHSAQFRRQHLLFFGDHLGFELVTGALRRMTRASTNIIGT